MKKTFLICICFLTILVSSGCKSDKRELESEWFDTFILESYYYSYKNDNGEKTSGWTPIRENSSYSFGNSEQNEFFKNCKTLLGSSLKFDGNIIEFDGEYKKEVIFKDLLLLTCDKHRIRNFALSLIIFMENQKEKYKDISPLV